MAIQIVKATKYKSLLRGAIFGPAGSGKTLTSLLIANGFIRNMPGKRIGVIDTERRAQKYAGHHPALKTEFDFDRVDIADETTLENYVEALNAFAQSGEHGFVIMDSSTHAWDSVKDQVSVIAKARYRGNEFAAWSEGTPIQRKFIDTIILYPLHIIWTMRSATEWKVNEKNQPVRIGLKPEQGKNIEYEADFLLEMTTDNICTVLKDTSGKFQGRIITKPGEAFGNEMYEWLNTGVDAPAPTPKPVPEPADVVAARALRACKTLDELAAAWKSINTDVRPLVVGVKDEMKATLSKPKEEPKAEPPAPDPAPAEPVQSASEQLFGDDGGRVATPEETAYVKTFITKITAARSKSGLIKVMSEANGNLDQGLLTEQQHEHIIRTITERAKEINVEIA